MNIEILNWKKQDGYWIVTATENTQEGDFVIVEKKNGTRELKQILELCPGGAIPCDFPSSVRMVAKKGDKTQGRFVGASMALKMIERSLIDPELKITILKD
jgi:vacuolar-type H+-ATPase subunit B/Vma2